MSILRKATSLAAICLLLILGLAGSGVNLAAAPRPDGSARPSMYGNAGLGGHVYRTGTHTGLAGAVVALYTDVGGGWQYVASMTTGADGSYYLCCLTCDESGIDVTSGRLVETDPPGYGSTSAEVIGCEYPCMWGETTDGAVQG